MAVSSALTSNDQTNLSGVGTLRRFLSVVPNTEVATALINQTTFTYPLVSLTVDTTSAGWANVAAGQTVYVGTSAGARDKGVYRVRKTGNATTIFLQEMGKQDAGLLPIDIRTAGFANNDHVTVYARYDLHSIMPKIDVTTGNIFEDYELAVSTYNTTPPILVDVTINGRRNHLFDYIDTPKMSIRATATVTKWPTSSGSTVSYAWTVPASWTGSAGTTSATLTSNAAPGNYLLYLAVTDSIGGVTNRVIVVNIHDATTNPPILISEMPRSDTRDRNGRRMAFDIYNTRLASIPDGTMIGYFEVSTWGGKWTNTGAILDGAINDSTTSVVVSNGTLVTAGTVIRLESEDLYVSSIATHTLTVVRGYNGTTAAAHADDTIVYQRNDVASATRQFVGWAQQVTKNTTPGLRDASLEIISPSHVLGLINGTSQLLESNATANTWQKIVPALSFETFVVWYMLKWRVANILLLFNYTPFSVTAAGQRLKDWRVDRGNVLQQLQQLATERSNFGCNSEGEFFYLRHPSMVAYASRSSVVTRDTLTAARYFSSTMTEVKHPRFSQVRGEAFSWDGSATTDTPYYCDAPKVPGQGGTLTKLPSQVVTNQDEINQLAGDYYALGNNRYPNGTTVIQKNRDVYEPAEMQFVSLTIPANLSPDGAVWTKNVIPLSVSKSHNTDGTSDITLSWEAETHNIEADYVPVPEPNDGLFSEPYSPPPMDEFPLPSTDIIIIPPAVPPTDPITIITGGSRSVVPGKGALRNTSTIGYRTFDVSVSAPTWEDIGLPAWMTNVKMVIGDRGTNFSRGAYALGNNGTDSRVYYTNDVYAGTPVWTAGADLTGLYDNIESVAGIPGAIYAKSGAQGAWTHTVDFTATNGNFHPYGVNYPTDPGPDANFGLYGAGGWGEAGVANYRHVCYIANLPRGSEFNMHLTSITFTTDSAPAYVMAIWLYKDGVNIHIESDLTPGTSHNWTGDLDVDFFVLIAQENASAGPTMTAKITSATIQGTGSNQWGELESGVTRQTRYSTDYGTTYGTARTIDTNIPATGMAVSPRGIAILAGGDANVRIALAGGTYADETNGSATATYPISIAIPPYKLGSTSIRNRADAPDYMFATLAQVSGESVWKVTTSGKTAVTPAVSGTDAVGWSQWGMFAWRGKRINFIGSVAGTIYMFTTANAGSTWVNVAMPGAISVRPQYLSNDGKKWLAACGSSGLKYSANGGATWSTRTASGDNLYTELFG